MITNRWGLLIFWAIATSAVPAAPSAKTVRWQEYRGYFADSVRALGLAHPIRSGITERTFKVIRSESEWSAYWEPFFKPRSEVAPAITPYPPIPEPPIGFSKFILIVASAGSKPTGGYAIEIASIQAVGAASVVNVLETVPGKTCATTQATTQPSAMALVERTNRRVEFKVSVTTHDCGL